MSGFYRTDSNQRENAEHISVVELSYKGNDLGKETNRGGSPKLPKETHFNRPLLLVIFSIMSTASPTG